MAVCFMFANYEEQYECEYCINKEFIEVDIKYDIEEEMEPENGVIVWTSNNEFKKRDILIIDSKNKRNYLLKNAYYMGKSSVCGTPDGGSKTKFRAEIYFEHVDYEKLMALRDMPKISKIRVFSKDINDVIDFSSVKIKESDKECIIELSKENKNTSRSIEVNSNGVKELSVSENWKCKHNWLSGIIINFERYIEITLMKRRNYTESSSFINELVIFMQLYLPNKFSVDKIWVFVDNSYYKLVIPHKEVKYDKRTVNQTVGVGMLEFLNNCYNKIPYKNSKSEIRNIPYIVLDTSRNIEDNFLMLYRFIECYYKKQPIKDITKNFISYSLKNDYVSKISLTDEQIEKYSQEIICLRNHYVHSGYFIKNSSLRISFKGTVNKKDSRNYTVTNLDIRWIYERTKILYEITLAIIFRKMLGYNDFKFQKRLN